MNGPLGVITLLLLCCRHVTACLKFNVLISARQERQHTRLCCHRAYGFTVIMSSPFAENILVDLHCWDKLIPFPLSLRFPSHLLRNRLPFPSSLSHRTIGPLNLGLGGCKFPRPNFCAFSCSKKASGGNNFASLLCSKTVMLKQIYTETPKLLGQILELPVHLSQHVYTVKICRGPLWLKMPFLLASLSLSAAASVAGSRNRINAKGQ